MDRVARWTTAHRVGKSWTQLSTHAQTLHVGEQDICSNVLFFFSLGYCSVAITLFRGPV